MLLAWSNKADAATLTTDSAKATLPVTNLQTPHVAQKWHTVAGVTAAYAIADMGSAVACDILALLGTNLTPTGTVRVRASSLDATVTGSLLLDTGVLTGAAKAGYGAIYKAFASTTARYWRIDLSDAAVAEGNLRVGRLFLGPSWTPTQGPDFGWAIQTLDDSPGDESYAGQEYDEEKPQRRLLTFVLDHMTEAEAYGSAFALARANGRVRDVLAIYDINGSYLSEQAVFGKLIAGEPIPHRLPRVYRQKFTIRERL